MNNDYLSATEFVNEYGTIPGPELPVPVANHALINIQSDLAMIIGGELDLISSEKTFYFNHTNKKWSEGPELNHDRFNHAVGIVTDEATHEQIVIVSGGKRQNGIQHQSIVLQ